MPEVEIDVLLAEDESVVCRAAERILGSEGLRVESASSSGEARERLLQRAYRVLLCDLMLPGGSGFEVVELARTHQPDLQTIVITGFATADNALRAFAEGVFDFLPKPFDWNELLGVVDRALRFREGAIEGRRPPPGAGMPGRAGAEEIHGLGRHSWALLDGDGSATLGAAETFFGCVGEVEEVDLPEVGGHTVQGQRLARLRTTRGKVHRIWAPLSGEVLEVQSSLLSDPTPILEDPFGGGWLARIVPSRRVQELPKLTTRRLDTIVDRSSSGPR